jgi:hypothetical protein
MDKFPVRAFARARDLFEARVPEDFQKITDFLRHSSCLFVSLAQFFVQEFTFSARALDTAPRWTGIHPRSPIAASGRRNRVLEKAAMRRKAPTPE